MGRVLKKEPLYAEPNETYGCLCHCFWFACCLWHRQFLRQQREAAEEFRKSTQDVIVAAKEIPAGTALTEDMVKLTPYLKTSLPPGFFSSAEAVKGKITKTDLNIAEPMLEGRLGEKTGLTMLLTPGQRAMAVQVNEVVGVSGFISPNDRVDVIANITPPGQGEEKATSLENCPAEQARALGRSDLEERKDGKPQIASSITLELTPDEVEKLSVASREGSIILALRGQADDTIVATQGSTARDLLNIVVPQTKSAPPVVSTKYRVSVYMGDKKSEFEF
jgi:pilus assembly protein CpaB